jgi:hypothetical protein
MRTHHLLSRHVYQIHQEIIGFRAIPSLWPAKTVRDPLERRHLAGQWNISIDSEFEN